MGKSKRKFLPTKPIVRPKPVSTSIERRALLQCSLNPNHQDRFTVLNAVRNVNRFKEPVGDVRTSYVCSECGSRAIEAKP